MRTCVFLGPTLPRNEAASLLKATYLPPVRRGDLDRAVSDGFQQILIVDGVFFDHRSISLTEIRAALNSGIILWGTSSMGALRAVEARTIGMRGIGEVFDMYCNGRITGDDEVALLFTHGMVPDTWTALSEPLVCIRAALGFARSRRLLSEIEAFQSLELVKRMYYKDRTLALAFSRLDAQRVEELVAFLEQNRPEWDVKRNDAIQALRQLDMLAGGEVAGA